MALIVENGTGLSTAESFISVTAADTRHSNLGNTNWATLSTAQKEEALRRGTIYMEQAYRDRWQGNRHVTTQALSWPRNGVVVDGFITVESNIVPADIANACADLAFKASAEDLAPDLERAIVRDKTGPIETEWDRASPQAKRFRSIDMALAPYLKGGSGSARLVRA